jgi:hypothetical protein
VSCVAPTWARDRRAAVYERKIPNFQGLPDSSLVTLGFGFFEDKPVGG